MPNYNMQFENIGAEFDVFDEGSDNLYLTITSSDDTPFNVALGKTSVPV